MGIIRQMAIGLLVAAGVSQPAIAQSPPPQSLSLQNLPTGEYYYQRPSPPGRPSRAYVLLRKVGRTVIGLDVRLRERACFRGFIEDNRIVDATRVLPPYQPDSQWQYGEGVMLDLDAYQRIPISPDSSAADPVISNQALPYAPISHEGEAITPEDRATLQTCIELFWR